MKIDSPQLDYAPAPPLYRRKRFVRMLMLALLLAAIYPAWRWGPPAWNQAKLLYLQRRCLNYSAPADQVVYDQNSPTSDQRQKNADYQVLLPPVWGANAPTAMKAAGRIPREREDFSAYFTPQPILGTGATLFMHERVSKTGVRRLVIVQRPVVGPDYPFYYVFGIQVNVIEPATFSKPPSAIYPARLMQPISWPSPVDAPPTKGLRFYAGQIDKADDAHFTIQYELNGKRGLIDGRLNDAGDDVILRVLDGPAINTVWVTQVLP